jgi:uracil-DNA glycosylase
MSVNEQLEDSLDSSWEFLLREEFQKDYYLNLKKFLALEVAIYQIYPSSDKVFDAFRLTPINNVKVVILGQDPYHGEGQAHGLSFSVPLGIKAPPSLRNIFKELSSDLGEGIPMCNCLERWAMEGVLLLNATLTVRAKSPGSHQKKGWEEFTDEVIRKLSSSTEGLVFILWGSYAQKKGLIIDKNKHLVLQSSHPSPFSAHRGFLGSKPFSQVNEYLKSKGKDEINWTI